MLDDKFVENAFSEAGWWKDENIYFLGLVVKPGWKVALEHVNMYAALASKNTYALINKTEDGIAIIPLKLEKTDFVLLQQLSSFIPNAEIQGVEIKNAFMAKKVVVRTHSGKPSSFTVEKKNGRILQHESNFMKFLSMYS